MLGHTAAQDDDIRRATVDLLDQLRRCVDEEERRRLRHRLVVANLPVATSIAMRYRSRGASLEDLVQAANLGLVKAVNGFDPDRGNEFMAYAVPTIAGEVKRYFRDQGWDIRPPRRVQELRPEVERASAELTQHLGRSPRVSELAEHLAVGEEDVIECISSAEIYHLSSLDAPIGDAEHLAVADTLGEPDPALAKVDDLMTLRVLLDELPARDRRILALRFFSGWTQAQIAGDIGVTQMQVSRLISKVLARLRAGMTAA
ncbi:MAG TPA: SigB/SigF/SigG family RNA polymerase sigma factor [Kineosporiaceae bacterium]|nr:SigB/SigF/SigG family RNA polymerase sigma factor [Kineosporiaceae bacterium]